METDQSGDQGDNFRQQLQHFDDLLEEQQSALRDLLASPLGTKDEDDDLADELEDLARSEELLRQELTKLPNKADPVEPSNSQPIRSQFPEISHRPLDVKETNAAIPKQNTGSSYEEHGIIFYRDNWDDELFRYIKGNDHHDGDYDNVEELTWNVGNFVSGPGKGSPDKSLAELDMMLSFDQPTLSITDEEHGRVEKRQKRRQITSDVEEAAIIPLSATIYQSTAGPTVTPQKELQDLNVNNELSFTKPFLAKTPSPSKESSMSITPQSTDAPTPTRAPSPLKNKVAKLWFGKPAAKKDHFPSPASMSGKRPWFSRTPPPAAAKSGERAALPPAKTPPYNASSRVRLPQDPAYSVERISTNSESPSTPTLVSILQDTMAFNPLEEHHEQVLGSLMLSPENIVFESSSDDDTYDKSIEHARKNLDYALEGKLAAEEGASSLAAGSFPDESEISPALAGHPGHVRRPSLGDREPPQRWSPASSSGGSRSASSNGVKWNNPEIDYARATPKDLYPEFHFYALKSEDTARVPSSGVEQLQPENALNLSPVRSLNTSSDSASFESALEVPATSASIGTSSGNDALSSNEARSLKSVEEPFTKGSSTASQSFVTAMDDIPFSGSVSVKTISSGDASHITYATAREQEEESSSLVNGRITSGDSLDDGLSNMEAGNATVETVAAPAKDLTTYRNSDSDSETSQSRTSREQTSSCLHAVKQGIASPLPILLMLVILMAAVGISIRLIIESSRNENATILVPEENFSMPSLSPSTDQLSSEPLFPTSKPTMTPNIPSRAPSITPSEPVPFLGPTLTPTLATTLSTAPSTTPTAQSTVPSIIRSTSASPTGETLLPTRSTTSAAPSDVRSDLFKLLSSVSFDAGVALRNASTPQYAAYTWLSGDESLPNYSDDRLIQRYALATIYFSTDGDGWARKTGWLGDGYECKWYMRSSIGSCDLVGRIVSLNLDFNDIGGTIPPEIGLLAHLKQLDLGGGPGRQLSGSLPKEVGQLKMLKRLVLTGNRLTGTIPTEIGSLLDVEEIRINGNLLRGTVPTEISNLRNVRIIDLSDNKLTGSIASSVRNLTGLQSLLLDNNTFVGELPSEIGNLLGLQTLSLAGNRISGIPKEIGSLVNLTSFHLDRNEVSSSLPSTLQQLTNLRYLTLSQNKFNSTIPSTLGSLINLNELDLSLNRFTGTIPGEIGEINSRLRVLKLNGNKLTGSIPDKFSHLDRINMLALHDNLLIGAVPYTVCRVFEWIIPSFSVDCNEVDCPCCTFCCDEQSGCTCQYKDTEEEWRCY
ncbi:hypothetical protein FisN_17Hh006 [Fistulifera solaris]|uniref:Disease resistance R13L4/SHOC-2-like LRR domain-containing protein n=1 Tax=Fistulifera solaris TaxID=1519565 RepID=A0A1Z5K911_FISSO|nr:hypothetical protein FisN_17Hh006 [Fistulifera solaris]|eukprot:GAX22625.1 hypothetical protein FisN_17Hh006 [Fistulifera solaris]